MSDLVGNPEDRFSNNEAHLSTIFVSMFLFCSDYTIQLMLILIRSAREYLQLMFLRRN